MSQSLREALKNSPVVAEMHRQEEVKRQVEEQERKAKNANLQPHQRWWQNFRMPVTQFEIVIFVKVQAETWREAVAFIAARNLNKLTTRCKTREEAIDQVRAKILAWQQENVLTEAEPPAGALLYWRIYDKDVPRS